MSHSHLPDIKFDTSLYTSRYGKQPRGYGLWAFSWKNTSGGYNVTEWTGWYSDAKAKAREVARKNKQAFPWIRIVNVLP